MTPTLAEVLRLRLCELLVPMAAASVMSLDAARSIQVAALPYAVASFADIRSRYHAASSPTKAGRLKARSSC